MSSLRPRNFWHSAVACFCAARTARRTARTTATSAWWRTAARSGKTAQRTVLYLGEINDQQQAAWRKTLEVFDEQQQRFANPEPVPDDREIPADAVDSCR